MKQEPTGYRAYMLRIWIMENGGCPEWRLSLEDVHGDTRIQFKGVADFIVYLLTVMEGAVVLPESDRGSFD